MQCKACGAELKMEALFCAKCGQKNVQEQEVVVASKEKVVEKSYCVSCKKEIKEGAKFCGHCGADQEVSPETVKVEPELPVEEVQIESELPSEEKPQVEPEVEEAPTTEEIVQVGEEQAAATTIQEEAAQQEIALNKPKKSIGKWIKLSALVVIVGALCILLAKMASGLVGGTGVALLQYRDTDDEVFIQQGSNKPVSLGDYYDLEQIYFSDGAEQIYYVEDYDLYKVGKKENKKIATDLDGVAIAQTGGAILALNEDDELLYIKDDVKEVITSDEIEMAMISPNGQYVVYKTYGDDEVLLYESGKKSIEVPTIDRPMGVNSDGQVLGVEWSDSNYYVINKNGEKEKIGSELSRVWQSGELNKIYFLDESGSEGKLKCYENGKVVDIEEKIAYVECVNVTAKDVKLLITGTNDKKYITLPNGAVGELGKSVDSYNMVFTPDGQTVYYLSNSRLYMKTFDSKGGIKVEEKLASDVYGDYAISTNGKYYMYIDEMNLYKGEVGKKAKLIAEDVYLGDISNSGDLWFVDYSDTLYLNTGGKKNKEVLEDVINIQVVEDTVYALDYDDNLHSVKSNGKAKAVAQDVEDFTIMSKQQLEAFYYLGSLNQIQ